MTVRVIMEGMTSTCLGIQCDGRHKIFIYPSGAVSHWENFDRDGNCPDAPKEEDASK